MFESEFAWLIGSALCLQKMEDILKPQPGSPAWPMLLGVQGLILSALALMVLGSSTPRDIGVSALEQRLLALDIPRATAAIDGAVASAVNPTALKDSDVLRVTSFLALAGSAAGLHVDDIRIESVEDATAPAGVEVIEALIDVTGDLYDLPIFVDGAHRQRAVGTLQSLAFDVKPGGSTQGSVRFRYHRPVFSNTDWIGPHLAVAAPGAAAATDVLISAAELQAWRGFNETNKERRGRATSSRSRAARDLPPNFVALRTTGGRFIWHADAGIEIR
jgi:hypothetical protein